MTTGDIPALIAAEAQAQGVPTDFALGIWRAEGSPDMSARSPKGAIGVMQLEPGTAQDLGVDPTTLAGNIKGGVGYIKQQLDAFGGDRQLAAAAYNAGPGAVQAHGGVPPYRETQRYVATATGAPAATAADQIFADPAPGASSGGPSSSSAPAAPDGPAAAQIFDGTDPTEPPPGPAPAPNRKNAIVITNADTGEPYGDDVEGQYGAVMKQPGFDPNAPIGSRAFPRAMADGGEPGPGEWYVDAQGLHQAPGVAPHTFGSDFASTVSNAYGKLGDDLKAFTAPPAPARTPGEFLKSLKDTVWGDLTLPGDAAAALFSPITGAVEGGVVQPGASLLDKLPVTTYAAPLGLGMIGTGRMTAGPQALSAGDAHDAHAAMLRTALSAVPADQELGAGAGMFGDLAAARDAQGVQATLTPEQLAAGRYVQGKLPSGVTPDALRAADPRLTAAEAIGQPGQVAVGALARREGDTGDLLGDAIRGRQEDRGDQVLQAISDAAGIQPAATRGALDRMVENGQAEAEPLYQAAFDDRPMWSDTLQRLAQRPSIKGVLKNARDLMLEEDQNPETLGIGFVEDPEQWASYQPPAAAEPAPNPVGFAGGRGPRGPSAAPSQGPSLLKFIADNGGIDDASGDVAAMGGDQWHLGRAYQRKLIGSEPPDYVAQRAFEAGYFPDRPEAPDVNELYDAIGNELRGRALYARPADQAALDRFNRVNAWEEQQAAGGVHPDDLPNPEDYVGRPEPQTEPAYQAVPKTQTWDYIKRALDDQLKPYLTGKLEWTDEARLMNQTRAQLVEELGGKPPAPGMAREGGLNPQYGVALDAAGDYLSAKQAFQDGRNMIFDRRTDETDFANRLRDMTPMQRKFLRAGIANKAYEAVMTAATQPTGFLTASRTPLAQAKFRMAFGAKRAAQLQQEIASQAKMKGFEDRYGPRSNSVTSDMSAEIANQDQQGFGRELGAAVARNVHRGPRRALEAGVGHVLSKMIATLQTPGMPLAVRNEAGLMLTGKPGELADVLAKLNEAGVGRRPLPRRLARGMIGGGVLFHTAPNGPTAPRRDQILTGAR